MANVLLFGPLTDLLNTRSIEIEPGELTTCLPRSPRMALSRA